jgi:hypothetical protein
MNIIQLYYYSTLKVVKSQQLHVRLYMSGDFLFLVEIAALYKLFDR